MPLRAKSCNPPGNFLHLSSDDLSKIMNRLNPKAALGACMFWLLAPSITHAEFLYA